MEPDEFILALLHAVPGRKIEGKKRLQKLVFLLKEAGADCAAHFKLKDFGPYSAQVENSTVMLCLMGDVVSEEVNTGYANNLMTVFRLERDAVPHPFDHHISHVLSCLNKFSTVELEVAATVRYFQSSGYERERAVSQTVAMKPTKANLPVLEKAFKVLDCI